MQKTAQEFSQHTCIWHWSEENNVDNYSKTWKLLSLIYAFLDSKHICTSTAKTSVWTLHIAGTYIGAPAQFLIKLSVNLPVVLILSTFSSKHHRRKQKGTYCHLGITPNDSEKPPLSKGLEEAIDYCGRNKLQLIVGCHDHVHHIIQGSMDISPQNA